MGNMDLEYLFLIFFVHLATYWGSVLVYDRRGSWACAKQVLINQCLITPWVAWIPLLHAKELDTLHMFWQIPVAVEIVDVLFYTIHRFFHTPYMYRRYHVVHHTYEEPFAMAALYAHHVEHLLANAIPPLIAGVLTRMNTFVYLVWIAIGTINTIVSHSKENQHTTHHRRRNRNFGVGLLLLDRAFGTLA